MPKKCCISNCKVQQDDPAGFDLSFYKIPADEKIREQWLQNIERHCDVQVKKYSYVCSRHFEEQCFDATCSGTVKRKLKRECCPTIFLDFKNLNPQEMTKKNIGNVHENIDLSSHLDNETSITECEFDTQETTAFPSTTALQILTHQINDTSIHTEQMSNVIDNEYVITEESTTTDNRTLNLLSNEESSSHLDSTSPLIEKQTQKSCENRNVTTQLTIDSDVHANNYNSSNTMTNLPKNIFKKSLGNIDLKILDFSPKNVPALKTLLYNGQNEIRALRRKLKSRRMQIYRCRKRVTGVKSLISHIKQRKYVSDEICNLLEVSTSCDVV